MKKKCTEEVQWKSFIKPCFELFAKALTVKMKIVITPLRNSEYSNSDDLRNFQSGRNV